MNFNSIDDIKSNGFVGFKKIKDLFSNNSSIPSVKGIYFVLYFENKKPNFLNIGKGPSLYKKKQTQMFLLKNLKQIGLTIQSLFTLGKQAVKIKKDLKAMQLLEVD